MDLELVRVAVELNTGDTLHQVVLVPREALLTDILSAIEDANSYMFAVHGLYTNRSREIGRVSFHQEDAYALGLKVGDIL